MNWRISALLRRYIPPDDIDREQLRLSTEEARRLIAESGRYQLVDVGAANDEAAKAGKLHDCEGCEAKIAAGLDADQSMIGIVTRISRTDYAVTYKIRDARSGALVDVEQTDLRAGANAAWSRGARWLIQRRLLEQANRRPRKATVIAPDGCNGTTSRSPTGTRLPWKRR